MAGEKITEKDQPLETELKSAAINKSAERDVISGINGIPSELKSTVASLGNAPSSKKGETNEESAGELGASNQPTVFNNYLYPAYSGPFIQVDNNGFFHTDASQTGMQSDNGSLIYYLPGCNPYGTGAIVGVDGQCVGQQPYFSSSGYLQHHVSYGSEAMPCYTWDSTYVGDAQNGNCAGFGNAKYGGSAAYGKPNGFKYMKTNGNDINKFSESSHAQPTKPLSKVPQLGSDFTASLLNKYPSMGKYSSFANQKQSLYPLNGLVNYKKNGRQWNGNDRYNSRDRFSRNGDLESAVELTRGPRAHNKSAPLDSSVKKEELGLAGHRDQYNLADFQTEYEKAKFYVIKSYNEDDIHKCIKYDVWASTPNGNKKLDTAFREVELKTGETGTRCPIFLFFSVNGSGQFVGLAEMIGQVDFNKDMDFWQLDKWNGFFPVKWHVIKDVPNAQLRHIILENNENKPVTHSRDTQEIGLQQGLEMLKIFKGYTAKSSLLDDFNFYETREKSQNVKKSSKPATQNIKDDGFPMRVKAEERRFEDSLINLTKNLSLGALPTEEMGGLMKSIENSVPSVAAAP